MSVVSNKLKTRETDHVEQALRALFRAAEDVESYRYNSASIRARVIAEAFAGKSRIQREEMAEPAVSSLPQAIQDDLTVLLLLTPEEHQSKESMLDREFDNPTPSRL